jgi:hypothetical protein
MEVQRCQRIRAPRVGLLADLLEPAVTVIAQDVAALGRAG